jgi:hypothetical protein
MDGTWCQAVLWVKEAEIGETWYMLGDTKVVFMIILKW